MPVITLNLSLNSKEIIQAAVHPISRRPDSTISARQIGSITQMNTPPGEEERRPYTASNSRRNDRLALPPHRLLLISFLINGNLTLNRLHSPCTKIFHSHHLIKQRTTNKESTCFLSLN
jgi:hypothetical protein